MNSKFGCQFGREIGPTCHGHLSGTPQIWQPLYGDTRNCAYFFLCTVENKTCQATLGGEDYSSGLDCILAVGHSGRHVSDLYGGHLVWEHIKDVRS